MNIRESYTVCGLIFDIWNTNCPDGSWDMNLVNENYDLFTNVLGEDLNKENIRIVKQNFINATCMFDDLYEAYPELLKYYNISAMQSVVEFMEKFNAN